MFTIEKPILFVEDIASFFDLTPLTILRHCRGERFCPTLGENFPAPICRGPGNKLKWISADFFAWLAASRTSNFELSTAPVPAPVPEQPMPAGEKRKRGRPPNLERTESAVGAVK